MRGDRIGLVEARQEQDAAGNSGTEQSRDGMHAHSYLSHGGLLSDDDQAREQPTEKTGTMWV